MRAGFTPIHTPILGADIRSQIGRSTRRTSSVPICAMGRAPITGKAWASSVESHCAPCFSFRQPEARSATWAHAVASMVAALATCRALISASLAALRASMGSQHPSPRKRPHGPPHGLRQGSGRRIVHPYRLGPVTRQYVVRCPPEGDGYSPHAARTPTRRSAAPSARDRRWT